LADINLKGLLDMLDVFEMVSLQAKIDLVDASPSQMGRKICFILARHQVAILTG
jgi:hypothetical protein